MPYLVGHFDRCTGCAICQLACSARVHGGYNPPRGNLFIEMGPDNRVNHPVVCHQCDNAFCLRVCPTGAISRSADLAIPVVDREVCIGCGQCADACPIGMIRVWEKKAYKCDLCGGAPECVAACPADALSLVGETEAAR